MTNERKTIDCPNVHLNNGDMIPILGLGTWKSKPNEVKTAVIDAVTAGYRHIDCAYVYGNEHEVGSALKILFDNEIVDREDLFITSKLWSTYHSKHLVEEAIKKSLKELRLDYLDLYLVHWPMAYEEGEDDFPKDADGKMKCIDVDYLDTWKGMEGVLKKKLTKAIGVSNFNHEQINRIIDTCDIPPAVLQIECHPYLTQSKLLEYCKNMNITVTAYSPLGSPDRPWAKEGEPSLLEDEKLVEIAEKYKKTVAQVLIRFQIDRGVVVIPKSVTKQRIVANSNVFDFKLSQQDIKTIESFNKNHRFCGLEWVSHSKYYPFSIEY